MLGHKMTFDTYVHLVSDTLTAYYAQYLSF